MSLSDDKRHVEEASDKSGPRPYETTRDHASAVQHSGMESMIEDAGAPSMIQPSGDGTLLPAGTPTSGIPYGSTFAGRYTIMRAIAHGGMGTVYMAKDNRSGEVVCVKVIRPELMQRERYRQLFLEEGKLARRLSHENIARVYDVDQYDSTLFISMEFVDGMNLRQWIQKRESAGKPITLTNTMWVARRLLGALDYLHRNKIVHRDIKPENILIAKANKTTPKTLKLVDFGLAIGVYEEELRQSMIGKAIGTRDYIAPEQREGKPVDQRADIYSAAAVIYRMLAGVPYDGHWEPIFGRNDVPPAVGNLLRAGLSKHLGKRPENATAMLRDLESAIKRTDVPKKSVVGETPFFSRRNKAEVDGAPIADHWDDSEQADELLERSVRVPTPTHRSPIAAEPLDRKPRQYRRDNSRSSFADQVSFDVLMARIVPPYRPPRQDTLGKGCVGVIGLAMLILGLAAFPTSAGLALFLILVGVLVIAGVWLAYRAGESRRWRYESLYKETRDLAAVMLTGPHSGSDEVRLRANADVLVELQEPEDTPGGWVFVWWDSG